MSQQTQKVIELDNFSATGALGPLHTLVGNHYHFSVKYSVSWHSSSAQALWFYLSFSFRPAFHRYSCVSCSCLHSERGLWKVVNRSKPGHTWSPQIFHRTEGVPLQISASVSSTAPRRHMEAFRVLKHLWLYVFKTQKMCFISAFHKCIKCLSQGDFKTFQDLESPQSLWLQCSLRTFHRAPEFSRWSPKV